LETTVPRDGDRGLGPGRNKFTRELELTGLKSDSQISISARS